MKLAVARGMIIAGLTFLVTYSVPCFAQSNDAAPTEGFQLRPRTKEISTLVVYQTEEGSVGRCEPVGVSVMTGNNSAGFRVGIYESEVGGTGSMWRSAAWMSTAAAALANGFSQETRHVTFDVTGRIDGPSAGAIMTIGILAASRQDPINPEAAMTGMINPDFSVGPVGGIPHKIRGAAEAGKKLVLIPSGSRFDIDKNLNREVDLVELGKSLGVTVVPVSDLYDAYQKLTGRNLPRWPASDDEPRWPSELEVKSLARTREQLVRFQQTFNQFENCPDEAKSDVAKEDMQKASRFAEQANGLLRENDLVSANRLAFEASYTAASSYQSARLSDVYQKRGLEATIKDIKSTMVPWARIDLAIESMKGAKPQTLREATGIIDAYSCLIEAINYAILGDDLMKRESTDEDETLENAVDAAVYYQYASIDLEAMKESLEDLRGGGGPAAPSPERVALAAQLFRRVAEANLAMFETLYIEPKAKAEGMTTEAAQSKFMNEEFSYSHLRLGLRVLKVLQKQLGNGTEYDYATLTTMRDAYVGSALLIAKYYSLQVVEDEDKIVQVGRERTLRGMLDFAEDQARRGISHLNRNGLDAASPISGYMVARMKRERDVADKIDALSYLWSSNLNSQIIAVLGGFEAQGRN